MSYLYLQKQRRGLTLVELLLVVAVLVILVVITVPTVQLLTRDRKIRNAAGMVQSVFTAARAQAAIDGSAGVQIETVRNLPNMAVNLYRMRPIPPYIGTTINDFATITSQSTSTSTVALSGGIPTYVTIQVGDQIEFNNTGVRYGITRVAGSVIDFAHSEYVPDPTNPSGVNLKAAPHPPSADLSFKIYRQPVRIESSKVELPKRHFINLGFSGYGTSETQLSELVSSGVSRTINILFDRSGAIERIDGITPHGPLYLFVCSVDGDEIALTNDAISDIRPTNPLLKNQDNRWIVINHRSGQAFIAKNILATSATSTVSQARADAAEKGNYP